MEVDLLKQIARNTAHKTSFQIIVSGNESSFNSILNPTLQLDRDKEYSYVHTQLFFACTCVYLFLVSPVAIF